MMMTNILNFITGGLIEIMAVSLGFALLFRYLAYRHSRLDYLFFSTFSTEVDRRVQKDRVNNTKVDDVDRYITRLLRETASVLPKRKIRSSKREKTSLKFQDKEVVSLRDYATGERSLIAGIQDETSSFQSSHPPNFLELTMRLMARDAHWTTLFRIIPIDRFSRVLDILPGIFIVLGIFGTFVGISQALPEIAKIDPNNLDQSGEVLSQFVLKVTYAMDTSIFGIVSSLVLTLINALFPIAETRQTIFKRVSNSLERLWYFIHVSTSESQLSVVFPEILKSLHKIEQNTGKQIGNSQAS